MMETKNIGVAIMADEKSRARYKKWYENNKEEARRKKRDNMRKYRPADPEKYNTQATIARKKLKEGLFDIYGRACALCGFDDIRALTLDHRKNNGNQERRELGMRGVYRRALKNIPDEYRTLCMNCQFIERVKSNRENQHGKS